jgi:hypothetical protein
MSSERSRIAIIFGLVALVTGGAAFYFFKIYQPRQVRADAQAEIAAWDERWTAARQCLLGPSPASSRTSEALAIHELSPDPWDRGSCTKLVGKLSRGEGTDSGLPDVEAAWGELEHAATKAALAFGDHLAKAKVDRLPAALDALDTAHGNLRTAAGMPVETTGGSPLPAAQLLPITDGVDRVTSIQVDETHARPSAHGVLYLANTANHVVQLALRPGVAPKTDRVGPHTLRGVPDANWGATATEMERGREERQATPERRDRSIDQEADGVVHAGPIDVEGAFAAPATLAIADGKPAFTGELVVAAAVGTSTDRTVVYKTATKLAIAHTRGAGDPAFASEPIVRVDPETARVFEDLDGRAVITWLAATQLQTRVVAAGTLRAPLAIPAVGDRERVYPIDAGCFSTDRAWLQQASELLTLPDALHDPAPAARPSRTIAELIGCTPDGALARAGSVDGPVAGHYALCTDKCRDVTLEGAPPDAGVTIVDGKLVGIAVHDGVLGVWREGAAPRFFALPEPGIHAWSGMPLTDGVVIDALLRGTDGFSIVRIPAR